MADDEDAGVQSGPHMELTDAEKEQVDWQEQRDQLLLAAESGGKLDRIQERVAWILNHYPDARQSDRYLWFRYWSVFESDNWDGESITLQDALRLTSPTSLTRSRAKIQNEYQLFLASPDVRQRRGTLAEEERDKAIAQTPPAPLFSVYADESGKTGDHLIVGSVWFLHAPEIIKMRQQIEKLKFDQKFKHELHFSDINDRNLDVYRAAADLIAAESTVVSFKAVSVERQGVGRVDLALNELFYLLIIRGVEHEVDTGRAPLPRRVALTKDLEEIGRDRILLASLHDRVKQAGAARFAGQLQPGEFIVEDSEKHQLLQVADLYTGSINRLLNNPGDGPKDNFARYFLERLGTPEGPTETEHVGDLTVHIAL